MANSLNTLKKRSEFTHLRDNGKTFHCGHYILVSYKLSAHSTHRFGWTIPKYTGNAIIRNRLKRWFREYFRINPIKSQKCYDINIVVKRKTKDFYKDLKHEDLKAELHKICQKFIKL